MAEISVVIPVYNTAPFLERCLDSLAAQSFKDWAAICVDDGSTDDSGRILDERAAADPRIKVIHKQNAGVSEARNSALPAVTGAYTMFVDSDDFLHPQAMEIALKTAVKDGSDLVAYTYDRRYRFFTALRHILGIPEKKSLKYSKINTDRVMSLIVEDIFEVATEYSRSDFGSKAIKHCQPWRCLYRTSLVRDIRFIKGIIYEDFPWWTEVMLNCGKASVINLPLYFYYPNKGSYILSARQDYRIRSLKIAIDAATEIMEKNATPMQSVRWQTDFLAPFKAKLERKERRYGG